MGDCVGATLAKFPARSTLSFPEKQKCKRMYKKRNFPGKILPMKRLDLMKF
jgi:hypothetical protein